MLAFLVLLEYIWLLAEGEIDGTEITAARHISMLLKMICLVCKRLILPMHKVYWKFHECFNCFPFNEIFELGHAITCVDDSIDLVCVNCGTFSSFLPYPLPPKNSSNKKMVAPNFFFVFQITASVLNTWGFMRGEHSSGVLFVFWFLLTITEALSFASNVKRWSEVAIFNRFNCP